MMVKIYNYNSKTDGWKKVHSEGPGKEFTFPQGTRKDITLNIPLQHYFRDGKSMCAKYPSEPADTMFMNNPANYCSDCLVGARLLAKEANELLAAGDESKNVIDYHAAEKKDKPAGAKSSK